jgi:prophage maintenance system killer protein/prophage antirepressor-like protein
MKNKKINEVAIYQAKNGAIELRSDIQKETIWASQLQIAEIFNVERSVVTKHVGNIFKSKEIDEKSNVQKMHIANSDKPVIFYSLDIILAIGYRANSVRAISFRRWATKILREHITKGYTINPAVVKRNYTEFQKAVEQVKKMLPAGVKIDNSAILELISAFADTWLSLEAYDKDTLSEKGITKKSIILTGDKLVQALWEFKQKLIANGQTTNLFGQEKQAGSLSGIVGNVMQSFGGQPLYTTIEEKAAHLLYFMVKDHPFIDGNKRSGAFAFIWFLRQAKILDTAHLTPPALTALTLLVAESNSKNKEKMIRLILTLLIRRSFSEGGLKK